MTLQPYPSSGGVCQQVASLLFGLGFGLGPVPTFHFCLLFEVMWRLTVCGKLCAQAGLRVFIDHLTVKGFLQMQWQGLAKVQLGDCC